MERMNMRSVSMLNISLLSVGVNLSVIVLSDSLSFRNCDSQLRCSLNTKPLHCPQLVVEISVHLSLIHLDNVALALSSIDFKKATIDKMVVNGCVTNNRVTSFTFRWSSYSWGCLFTGWNDFVGCCCFKKNQFMIHCHLESLLVFLCHLGAMHMSLSSRCHCLLTIVWSEWMNATCMQMMVVDGLRAGNSLSEVDWYNDSRILCS